MLPGILGIIPSPRKLLYAAIAAMALLAIWQAAKFVNTAMENARMVESLQLELQLKDREIATQKLLLEQARKSAEIAEAARIEAERREGELRQIRDAILQSGDDKDGPLAPVLADTLRAIRQHP